MTSVNLRKAPLPAQGKVKNFFIDCSMPSSDGIFNCDNYLLYMQENFKVDKVRNNLVHVDITMDKEKQRLKVSSKVQIKKKYLKFLTKKYLNKQNLRDYVRIIVPKGNAKCNAYALKYYAQCEDFDEPELPDDMEED